MAAQKKYGDQITFIGIAGQDEIPAMEAFVEEFNLSGFEHVGDTSGEIWNLFGIRAQPAYVFVNDNATYDVQTGGLPDDVFEARLESLLTQ